jgi:hypothetical protein
LGGGDPWQSPHAIDFVSVHAGLGRAPPRRVWQVVPAHVFVFVSNVALAPASLGSSNTSTVPLP